VAYRQAGHANLHPADGVLNLPPQRHSHGLRQLAAVEASRGSFDEAAEAIGRATGVAVGKRQLEKLALAAAVDFEDFNAQLERSRAPATDVLVLTADGKGIVMRPEGLTEGTAKAAARSEVKLRTRLSKGEKTNRKRMATVGCVYDATPVPRAPTDVMASSDNQSPKAAPVAQNKWLVASVAHDAATVVNQIFDEATRRDPTHRRAWVALVDGNNHQIARIRAEADTRDVKVSIVCDFIHVLEYLWAAAWSFYREGDRHAEAWVKQKALAVLAGQSSTVAASIRRKATCLGLDPTRRANADKCATYLLNKRQHLDYPTALAQGWPIATGVIEGACRHVVKDRMDITGARWGIDGAEAILKLRVLRCNGDWPSYWTHHRRQEQRRVHEALYKNNAIPTAA
jgi:hypothetical protein